MRTFYVALLFIFLASLSSAYAQAAREITIRNESKDFTLISITIIAKGERASVDVMIDPGESKPAPISGDGPVDVDCDMGMNNVHFLFNGVTLSGLPNSFGYGVFTGPGGEEGGARQSLRR
jgi:hypothetical protein